MKLHALIKRLKEIEDKHGDIPVFRYCHNHNPPLQGIELRDAYLEKHKETPQMFGHEKVVELI